MTTEESEWTTDWPTVPGWYWVWKASDRPEGWPLRETVRVRWAGTGKNRHLLYTGMGAVLYESEWPGLHWGPRIDVPDAPDGTPGTRYAVAVWSGDQRFYLREDGGLTSCREAALFQGRTDADRIVAETPFAILEPIDDVDAFRGREDTLL
jgi:hypothetical protein